MTHAPQHQRREQPVDVKPVVANAYGKPVTQAEYDKLVSLNDRLLRLCQTHGLLVS